ncbi:MAG: hypothetical protein H7263_16985 [Candidatus Sericytochromatia bacterium]|nr:hypothetical protein [Candidatus Sericytochromatia bacterium]
MSKVRIIKYILVLLIPVFILQACNRSNADESISKNAPLPSISPVESPESYKDDIEEYEPTDSLSQDSDGPVH